MLWINILGIFVGGLLVGQASVHIRRDGLSGGPVFLFWWGLFPCLLLNGVIIAHKLGLM